MTWIKRQASHIKRAIEDMVEALVQRGYSEQDARQEIMAYVSDGRYGLSEHAQEDVLGVIQESGFEV